MSTSTKSTKTKKVCIIGTSHHYTQMFMGRGWRVVDDVKDADLVQFTGGADVSPELYNETRHLFTRNDPGRDKEEQRIFKLCKAMGIPMAGICRGGQFLNVMCGGSMWQHVDKHAIQGTHGAVVVKTGEFVPVTSTHHQMMRAGPRAELLAVASESTVCESMDGKRVRFHEQPRGEDVEALYYEEDNVLCFQPHPEYLDKDSPCQELYFNLIQENLDVAV